MQTHLFDIPVRYSFSGHESFPFRYTWLTKGVQQALHDPAVFSREDATIVLGVGKNMVRSIRYWCLAMGLLESPTPGSVRPTRLGEELLGFDGFDPYLEDMGTLWLLHWLLVRSGELASTWYLAFTRFSHSSFTRQQLVKYLLETASRESPTTRATESSIRRDVDVFVRTYVASSHNKSLSGTEESYDCPLTELGLLDEEETGVISFVYGDHPTLPNAILAFAIADYWEHKRQHQAVLSFEDVLYRPGSPGAAFKLTENELVARLEELPDWTGMRFDETAGRRVLMRNDRVVEAPGHWSMNILRHYYMSEGEE